MGFFKPSVLLIIIFCIILISCTYDLGSTSGNPPIIHWQYADVKRLDGIDARYANSDLLAGYSRFDKTTLQIRLDFLDLNQPGSYPINIYLNSKPGGISLEKTPSSILWDLKIEIDKNGLARLIDANTGNVLSGKLKSNITKRLDYLEIEIPLEFIDSNDTDIFVSVLDYSAEMVLDQLEPFSTAERTSPNPSPLLISFWDVLKSDTPAQLLRTWNGAHSGPYGTRHGLFHLFTAVEKYSIPVVLLDLKEPGHFPAFEYLDTMDVLRKMESDGLLVLPELAYGQDKALDEVLETNSDNSKKYGFRNHSFLFGTFKLNDLPPRSMAFSTTVSPYNILDIGNGIKLIPLPYSYKDYSTPITNQMEASGNRFPIELKQELINVALSPSNSDLVSIGESFQQSALGDPFISADFFEYIQNHPWIKPLNQIDLLDFPAQYSSNPLKPVCRDILCNPDPPDIVPHTVFNDEIPAALTYPTLLERVTTEMLNLPNNELSENVLLMYQQYFHPRSNSEFQSLQANYVGQIGHLIQAANWLESPEIVQKCFDFDWDGLPECILANEKIFSSYEIEGGRLLYLFIKNECGLISVIAPFSHYSVGLSDATNWNSMSGYLSDPYEVSGFLADQRDQIGNYHVQIGDGSLILSDPVKDIEKSFLLSKNELSLKVSYPNPARLSIPVPTGLNVDRSPDNESIIIQEIRGNKALNIFDKLSTNRSCVRIYIPGRDVQIISPKESIGLLKFPENPDTSYEPGYYLPFPFQLLQFNIINKQNINIISEN